MSCMHSSFTSTRLTETFVVYVHQGLVVLQTAEPAGTCQ